MTPTDVKKYVEGLEKHGLQYLRDESVDLVVVDQTRGPLARCAIEPDYDCMIAEHIEKFTNILQWASASRCKAMTRSFAASASENSIIARRPGWKPFGQVGGDERVRLRH
jgi:hypothetical protein